MLNLDIGAGLSYKSHFDSGLAVSDNMVAATIQAMYNRAGECVRRGGDIVEGRQYDIVVGISNIVVVHS
jgi:hypothetical protein